MANYYTPYGMGDTCRNDDKEESRPVCPECGERYGSHDDFVQDDFCSFECGESWFKRQDYDNSKERFTELMHAAMKLRGISKKERDKRIAERWLGTERFGDHDNQIEREEQKARNYLAAKKVNQKIPSEHAYLSVYGCDDAIASVENYVNGGGKA